MPLPKGLEKADKEDSSQSASSHHLSGQSSPKVRGALGPYGNDWRKVASNGNDRGTAWLAAELKAHFTQSSGKLADEFALVNGKLDAILDLSFNNSAKQQDQQLPQTPIPPCDHVEGSIDSIFLSRTQAQEAAPGSASRSASEFRPVKDLFGECERSNSDATSHGMDVGPEEATVASRPMQRSYIRSPATGLFRRPDDRGATLTPRSAWQSRRGVVKKNHKDEEIFQFVQSCSEAINEEEELEDRPTPTHFYDSRSNEQSPSSSRHLSVKHPDRRKDMRVSIMGMDSELLGGFPGADSPRGGLSSPHLGSNLSSNPLGSQRTSLVTTETQLTRLGSPHNVLRRGNLRAGNQAKMKVLGNLFGHEKVRKSLINGEPRINGLSEISPDILEEGPWTPACCAGLADFLEDAESSRAAGIYARAIAGVIIVSCFVNFIQTVKPPPLDPDVVIPIEILLDAVFLVEVLLRFYVAPQKLAFFLGINNIIDCVGSGPPLLIRLITKYFVEQSAATDDLRYYVLCLAPVLRLLKMLRRWQKFHLLIYSGVGLVMEVLPVLLVMLFLMAITFSSAIYFVEPRDNIEALPRALWMTIVTMTTVGYGDVTPQSTAGTIITSVLVITSALYMAVPLGIVGNAFSKVWESRDWLYLVQHVQERLKRNGYGATDIPELFKLFGGGEGNISMHEFHRMITEMKLGIRDEKIMDLFFAFDADGSGFIDASEFIRVIFPSQYTKLFGKTPRHPSNDQSRLSSDSGSQAPAALRYHSVKSTVTDLQSQSGFLSPTNPSGYVQQVTSSTLSSVHSKVNLPGLTTKGSV